MQKLYRFFLNLFLLGSTPFYFLKLWRRGNWRTGFLQRFGRYSGKIKQGVTNSEVLWIHAVSVGEVNLAAQLIGTLEPALPTVRFLVSTTTSTGMGELQRKLPPHILKIYYPIDRLPWVERALKSLHPNAIILVEAEIWPNFLLRARRRGIPVFLVNARMSPNSFRKYRRFGFLFRPLFHSLARVGAQSEADAERLRAVGCRKQAISVVGSLKYESPPNLGRGYRLDVAHLLQQIGVASNALILVGGSTHAGEEAMLARVSQRLRKRFPSLFLVLVPRHFERSKEIGGELESLGVRFLYRSLVTASTSLPKQSVDCLLVNSTGELRFFYEYATVVFVGKSLTARGGQNPIEPAALGKPILFGPHMENFPEIAPEFIQSKGAVQVHDEAELEQKLAGLLDDPALRNRMGTKAREAVLRNRGALQRTADMITCYCKNHRVFSHCE